MVAPIALTSLVLPQLRARRGRILNITSDASVEAYETWGGYGSSKAALDHATRVLAAEEPEIRVYAVDPGDLRTAMHQAAFPGEDISDRPEPASVVPHLMALVVGDVAERSAPCGRPRAGGAGMTLTIREADGPAGGARGGPRRRAARGGDARTRRRTPPPPTCPTTCGPATCWS